MAYDTLLEACRLGEALRDELVIDCHAHMGNWRAFYLPEAGTVEAMLRSMDRLGIDTVVSSAHLSIGCSHYEGNCEVIAANQAHPDRILPYVTHNPHCPWEPTLAQAEALRAQGRLYGFKQHTDVHGAAATHPGYVPLYEYANAYGLPVLNHLWNGSLGGESALLGLSRRYPSMSLIVAHSHGDWPGTRNFVESALRRDNIYLDMAGSVVVPGMLKWMVEKLGPERVLFGTDIPFFDPRVRLGYVLTAEISDEAKRLILGVNAKRLFGL
jgi:uncharacterized protein